MHENEVYQHEAFSRERSEVDKPARVAVHFEAHEVTTTITDVAKNIFVDGNEIFRKGERNVLWVEEGGAGLEMQRLFDKGMEKTGTVYGAYAFIFYAVTPGRAILEDPLTDAELEKLMEAPFGKFSQDSVMEVAYANAQEMRSYGFARMLAAHELDKKFGVEVVFENSQDLDLSTASDLESMKKFVRDEKVREERILSHWDEILQTATPEEPVNLLIHIGSMHHAIAPNVHQFNADALTINYPHYDYGAAYMKVVNKIRNGDEVSEREFIGAMLNLDLASLTPENSEILDTSTI